MEQEAGKGEIIQTRHTVEGLLPFELLNQPEINWRDLARRLNMLGIRQTVFFPQSVMFPSHFNEAEIDGEALGLTSGEYNPTNYITRVVSPVLTADDYSDAINTLYPKNFQIGGLADLASRRVQALVNLQEHGYDPRILDPEDYLWLYNSGFMELDSSINYGQVNDMVEGVTEQTWREIDHSSPLVRLIESLGVIGSRHSFINLVGRLMPSKLQRFFRQRTNPYYNETEFMQLPGSLLKQFTDARFLSKITGILGSNGRADGRAVSKILDTSHIPCLTTVYRNSGNLYARYSHGTFSATHGPTLCSMCGRCKEFPRGFTDEKLTKQAELHLQEFFKQLQYVLNSHNMVFALLDQPYVYAQVERWMG